MIQTHENAGDFNENCASIPGQLNMSDGVTD